MNDREFNALLARSSLGTPNARRLIRYAAEHLCGLKAEQNRIDELHRQEGEVTTIPFKTRYCDEAAAVIKQGRYHDGSIALRVFDQFGEPLTTATVCMSAYDEKPGEGCVFIKEHGENEGVLAALQAAGVVGESLRTLDAPMVDDYAHECALLMEVEEM